MNMYSEVLNLYGVSKLLSGTVNLWTIDLLSDLFTRQDRKWAIGKVRKFYFCAINLGRNWVNLTALHTTDIDPCLKNCTFKNVCQS